MIGLIMMEIQEQNHPKSYLKIYWTVYLIAVAILVLALYLSSKDSSKNNYDAFMVFLPVTWIPVMLLNFFEGRRLMNYLREKHEKTWEDITYVPLLGSGNMNSFRSLPFLFSKNDLGDPIVMEHKRIHRRFLIFVVTVFVSYPVLFTLLYVFD